MKVLLLLAIVLLPFINEGCASNLKSSEPGEPMRSINQADSQNRAIRTSLEPGINSFLNSIFFRELKPFKSGFVQSVPQRHSSQFMYVEENSPAASLQALSSFEGNCESLLVASYAQYAILQMFLKEDFLKHLQRAMIINEGSPGFDYKTIPPSDEMVIKTKKIFPEGLNLRFSDLTDTQMQVIAHLGAINLLYIFGKIHTVVSENPVCPRVATLPEFPELSNEQMFKATNYETPGPSNSWQLAVKSKSAESYKFWFEDREQRVAQIINEAQKKSPNNIFVVFGSAHAFENLGSFSVQRLDGPAWAERILGIDSVVQLKKLKYRLTDEASVLLTDWIKFTWKSFDLGICASTK